MSAAAHEPEGVSEPASLERPGLRDALRGLGVSYGPSLLVDAWWLVSLVPALRPAFLRHLSRPRRAAAVAVAAGALGPLVYHALARPRILFWGATREEMVRELPGDAILPNPLFQETRAITIHAPAAEVWKWLVQIAYGRGGWYSYDRPKAAAGAGDFREGRSATGIWPEPRELRVGDTVKVNAWSGMSVAVVSPGRLLVLHSLPGPQALAPTSTWAFVIEANGPESVRLLVRGRSNPDPRNPFAQLMGHLLEVPLFVMERRMLLRLKKRAEAAHAAGGASSGEA
ncbi:MAG: hypothetical protein C0506_14550 [Anaerolinea sp.]|nr:hypothetical protein [Anaerolinea sp.]